MYMYLPSVKQIRRIRWCASISLNRPTRGGIWRTKIWNATKFDAPRHGPPANLHYILTDLYP